MSHSISNFNKIESMCRWRISKNYFTQKLPENLLIFRMLLWWWCHWPLHSFHHLSAFDSEIRAGVWLASLLVAPFSLVCSEEVGAPVKRVSLHHFLLRSTEKSNSMNCETASWKHHKTAESKCILYGIKCCLYHQTRYMFIV